MFTVASAQGASFAILKFWCLVGTATSFAVEAQVWHACGSSRLLRTEWHGGVTVHAFEAGHSYALRVLSLMAVCQPKICTQVCSA